MQPAEPSGQELRQAALHWLAETDPAAKCHGVKALRQHWLDGSLALDAGVVLTPLPAIPGRPLQPVLVPPKELSRRAMHTIAGRAAMIHALAHIEFNAINLALDAIWRFSGLPPQFYADWLQVAGEEALHFELLHRHLNRLGHGYGDFPAHGGLWEMAQRTEDDVLARLALVPRILEARGLDVTPGLCARLAQAGDHAAAAILDIILRDEIGHVRIGNHWYAWLCAQRGLDPLDTGALLAERYRSPAPRGPFNVEARRAAGFSEQELAGLA
ncbi:MAG: ferritin-like domain-containing protein [Methylobacterium sp.]|nr:ferritin-like domain-containing protein [Methylobacterium sp.]